MSLDYVAELASLDRSHLLHVATFASGLTGAEITHALYRQPDGSAKLHVLSSDEEDESFVDVLDRDAEAAFLLAELESWDPIGRAS